MGICKGKDNLINVMFGCEQLLCFEFKDGKIVKYKNMSPLCKRIWRIVRSPEKLMGKKSLTHLQELFQRDYNKEVVQSKNGLYRYYVEYFSLW